MKRYLKKGQYGYSWRRKPEEGYDEISLEPDGEPLAYVAYKNGTIVQWLDGGMFAFETLEKAMLASEALGNPDFLPVYKAKEELCTPTSI